MNKQRPLNLRWAINFRSEKVHYEWRAPCGCAYHPEPEPHVHHCFTHIRKNKDKYQRSLDRITDLEIWLGEALKDNEVLDIASVNQNNAISKVLKREELLENVVEAGNILFKQLHNVKHIQPHWVNEAVCKAMRVFSKSLATLKGDKHD